MQSLLLPRLQAMTRAGLREGISIVLTLSKRLPTALAARRLLVDQVISAVHVGAKDAVLDDGSHVSVRLFDPSVVTQAQLEDRRALRRLMDIISGTTNRESMLLGSLSGGAILSTIQSSAMDEFKDALLVTANPRCQNSCRVTG